MTWGGRFDRPGVAAASVGLGHLEPGDYASTLSDATDGGDAIVDLELAIADEDASRDEGVAHAEASPERAGARAVARSLTV